MTTEREPDKITREDIVKGVIPDMVEDVLDKWFDHGINPGDFLMAVLEGDLFKASQRADATNKMYLANIARYVWWNAPKGSWYDALDAASTKEAVAQWKGDQR